MTRGAILGAILACATLIASSSACSGTSSQSGPTRRELCEKDCVLYRAAGSHCNGQYEAVAFAYCLPNCLGADDGSFGAFDACAQTRSCDPTCLATLTNPDAGRPAENPGAALGCQSACQQLDACGLITKGTQSACTSACTSRGFIQQVDCINVSGCPDIPTYCGAWAP